MRRNFSAVLILSLLSQAAFANVIQFFWSNTYDNPAQLDSTKKYQLTAGDLGVNTRIQFRGTGSGGMTGYASSDQTGFLPYLSAAARLNPRWVVGLNVSQPIYANSSFPLSSVVGLESTQTYIRGVDISPRASYHVNDSLSVGGGLIAEDMYNFQINFGQPGLGNTVNHTSAWSYGWTAGLFYILNTRNFFGLSYYSQLTPNLTGHSTVGPISSSHFRISGLILPPTTIANYVHMLQDNWLLSFKLFYSQWSRTNHIAFHNTANLGDLVFPLKYRDTWAFLGFTKYNFTEKYALLGGVLFDQGAANDSTRTVSFSTANLLAAFIGANVQIAKSTSMQLTYGYGYYNASIHHPFDVSATNGRLRLRANVLDFALTYAI